MIWGSNWRLSPLSLLFILLVFCAALPASAVELAVRPDVTLNAVDERIYGFLLEHIYHSCDNGVWGEEVFNRSFEDRANYGGFYIAVREGLSGLVDFVSPHHYQEKAKSRRTVHATQSPVCGRYSPIRLMRTTR